MSEKIIRAIAVLNEHYKYPETPFAVYDRGVLLARFVAELQAQAYRLWLSDE